MPYLDFFLLIIATILCFYSSFLILQTSFKSPIPFLYFLLSLAILSLGLTFLFIIPALLSETQLLQSFILIKLTKSQTLFVLQSSQFFALLFVLSFTVLTYSPSIKVSLKPLTIIIFSTMFSTAAFIIDANSVVYHYNGSKFYITYAVEGQIFLLFSLIILLYVLYIRYREIQLFLRSSDNELNPFTSNRARSRFYILIVLIIFSFLVGRIDQFLPTYMWAGFTSIGLVYMVYSFKKNPAFYFASSTYLEAVIVLNSQSGKVQYYKNFLDVDMLITGVMTAFNISLKHLTSSKTDIEQVFFEDKVLVLKRGEYTTTILFVSDKSILSDPITSYLSNRFETKFLDNLKSNPYGADQLSQFSSFEEEINLIKNFFTIRRSK